MLFSRVLITSFNSFSSLDLKPLNKSLFPLSSLFSSIAITFMLRPLMNYLVSSILTAFDILIEKLSECYIFQNLF